MRQTHRVFFVVKRIVTSWTNLFLKTSKHKFGIPTICPAPTSNLYPLHKKISLLSLFEQSTLSHFCYHFSNILQQPCTNISTQTLVSSTSPCRDDIITVVSRCGREITRQVDGHLKDARHTITATVKISSLFSYKQTDVSLK